MSHVSLSKKLLHNFEKLSPKYTEFFKIAQTCIKSIISTEFSFDGEYFHSAGSSSFSHRATYGMANFMGKALTTGCKDTRPECGVKTEIMDMHTLEWSKGPDYPFASL